MKTPTPVYTASLGNIPFLVYRDLSSFLTALRRDEDPDRNPLDSSIYYVQLTLRDEWDEARSFLIVQLKDFKKKSYWQVISLSSYIPLPQLS
jgi:hypothetical protein